MESSTGPWSALALGQRFRIKSVRGNAYEATFIVAGPEDAGLYVRLVENAKLARLSPDRLNWTTLEPGETTEPLVPGDEVIATPGGGQEQRGRLLEPADERVTLQTAQGAVFQVPLDRLESLQLLFPATDLRRGDEFLIKSATGSNYRGRAVRVEVDRLEVSLERSPGPPVSIRVDRLDLRSLRVLIPLVLSGTATPH